MLGCFESPVPLIGNANDNIAFNEGDVFYRHDHAAKIEILRKNEYGVFSIKDIHFKMDSAFTSGLISEESTEGLTAFARKLNFKSKKPELYGSDIYVIGITGGDPKLIFDMPQLNPLDEEGIANEVYDKSTKKYSYLFIAIPPDGYDVKCKCIKKFVRLSELSSSDGSLTKQQRALIKDLNLKKKEKLLHYDTYYFIDTIKFRFMDKFLGELIETTMIPAYTFYNSKYFGGEKNYQAKKESLEANTKLYSRLNEAASRKNNARMEINLGIAKIPKEHKRIIDGLGSFFSQRKMIYSINHSNYFKLNTKNRLSAYTVFDLDNNKTNTLVFNSKPLPLKRTGRNGKKYFGARLSGDDFLLKKISSNNDIDLFALYTSSGFKYTDSELKTEPQPLKVGQYYVYTMLKSESWEDSWKMAEYSAPIRHLLKPEDQFEYILQHSLDETKKGPIDFARISIGSISSFFQMNKHSYMISFENEAQQEMQNEKRLVDSLVSSFVDGLNCNRGCYWNGGDVPKLSSLDGEFGTVKVITDKKASLLNSGRRYYLIKGRIKNNGFDGAVNVRYMRPAYLSKDEILADDEYKSNNGRITFVRSNMKQVFKANGSTNSQGFAQISSDIGEPLCYVESLTLEGGSDVFSSNGVTSIVGVLKGYDGSYAGRYSYEAKTSCQKICTGSFSLDGTESNVFLNLSSNCDLHLFQ